MVDDKSRARRYDFTSTFHSHRDDQLSGDNVEAWELRCEPLLRFMARKGWTLTEIRHWGRKYPSLEKPGCPFGANLAEECLYWLEARGRVWRDEDRKWRRA